MHTSSSLSEPLLSAIVSSLELRSHGTSLLTLLLRLLCASLSNRSIDLVSTKFDSLTLCLIFIWRNRSRRRTNILLHKWHLYNDFSCTCRRMCLFKLLGSPNGRKQYLHLSGLKPVCVRIWIFRPYFREYNFPQYMQMCPCFDVPILLTIVSS